MSSIDLSTITSQIATLVSTLESERGRDAPNAETIAELEEGLKDLREMQELLQAQEDEDSTTVTTTQQPDESPTDVTASLVSLPWPVGSTILARYSGDGKEYEAVVLRRAPGPDSVAVRFLGYELEGEHIVKLADCSKEPVAKSSGSGSAPAIVVDTSALTVAPGDSDAVRDRKRRKLKELRRSARDAHDELATAAKQSSWQSFAGRKGIGSSKNKARRLR